MGEGFPTRSDLNQRAIARVVKFHKLEGINVCYFPWSLGFTCIPRKGGSLGKSLQIKPRYCKKIKRKWIFRREIVQKVQTE